jgi:protoporphyrin/coproporphyrin ferrochelatase
MRPRSAEPPVGVLVMDHGTPSAAGDIEPFYTAIRRGRPPTPELLDELAGRYQAIGGTSPLAERTRAQVGGIAAALEAEAPGRFVVRHGSKYLTPSIEAGMAELAGAGVVRAIGIVLTPHQSSLGSGEYFSRAEAAAASASPPLAFTPVASWHRAEGFADLLADRTRSTLSRLSSRRPGPTAVFFTAHSLPLRVVAEGDPYPGQVAETAADVAGLLGLDDLPDVSWGVAWQSAGRTADPWIGPDLLLEMKRVVEEGATSVVVCPVGFVSDHLEVLYDLDIEAHRLADSLGASFARTSSLNDDPRFLDLLAGVVRRAARTGGSATAAGSDNGALGLAGHLPA